eukprot:m.49791 g.49791  ORF g.49791 m.49791 type:complete len:414 (+) comp11517_c0_seq4:1122-2363(+)
MRLSVLLGICILGGLGYAQQVPSWTAPFLNPLKFPYGGAEPVPDTKLTRLFFATPEIGTYNMSPMLSFFFGQFLASWKCAPQDEDQPGQRILYSQSHDGQTWTPTDGTNELFPNMSTSTHHVALFAEPTLQINGRVYAAASPKQFCLYPDQYFDVLLLRRVDTTTFGKFGPIFWAAPKIPQGFEEASALRGVVTIAQMDATTQADIAMLADPNFAPCNASSGTAKCEYCQNGCQPWSIPLNITGIENERTHYVVPHSNPQTDVLLYRSRLYKEGGNHLYASVRRGLNGSWTVPIATNISDDVANINAGPLPDGRVYLLSNAMVTVFRDPLFISTTTDGWHFSRTNVVASCEMSAFRSPKQPWGCLQRYKGGAKEGGLQYPQGMAVTAPGVEGFYAIFSVNKEDIWVARLPLQW